MNQIKKTHNLSALKNLLLGTKKEYPATDSLKPVAG